MISVTSPVAQAQTSNALSAQELAKALGIEGEVRTRRRAAAAEPGPRIQSLESTPAGRAGKSVVTSVVPLGSTRTETARARRAASDEPSTARRAMVTRFDYATGATIRTTVNLETNAVIDERSNVNYPTGLAPEELTEAIDLLLGVPEVAALLGNLDRSRAEFQHLVSTSGHPSEPKYGHRLVSIWLKRPKSSNKFIVDLTTREVKSPSRFFLSHLSLL